MPRDACLRGAATAGAADRCLGQDCGNPSGERFDVMGRIMGCEMLIGAWSERLVVLEMGGHGSFVRLPELCLPVFGRFVTERE
jgi:hypothetical protein